MPRLAPAVLLTVALLIASGVARADPNTELNRMLEENAVASAYARACNEEPIADQLKSGTMMLLAVNGVDPQTVQLGSAKFNDVVRRTLAHIKDRADCAEQVRAARDRLALTQSALSATRRPAPPDR